MKPATPSSRFFLYVLYAIVLTFTLLYVRFPAEKFKIFCEQQVEQLFTDTSCNIADIGYGFPAAIVFEKVEIGKMEGEQRSVVVVDQIKIHPGIKFWNTLKIGGELYSGTLKASLIVDRAEKTYRLVDIVLKNLNLDEIVKDQGIVNRKVTGNLGGSGNFQAQWATPSNGQGKAQIKISSGSLEFLQPVLSLPALRYDQISFDMSYTEQLDIGRGKLKGADINAEFEGNVNIMTSLLTSRVNMSGLLEPRREFLQTHPLEAKMVKQYAARYKRSALPFKLGGTVSNPTFRFSR
jgi:type II secretion system protein N